jgi:DNA-binding response OmpR family regulator
MKLLIVDSDRDTVDMLTIWLKGYGYAVSRAYTLERARAEWQAQLPDLVLLDSVIDGANALAFCQEMLSKHEALILVMASETDLETEVRFLSSVADGFMTKPFMPRQLLAHLQSVTRRGTGRGSTRSSSIITVGPIALDAIRNRASVRGAMVRLTPTETKLLHLLAVNANDVCTAEQIVTRVWGYDDGAATNLIKTHIRRLREKLEPDPSRPRYIMTIPGVGYTLVRHAGEGETASSGGLQRTSGQLLERRSGPLLERRSGPLLERHSGSLAEQRSGPLPPSSPLGHTA